MDGDFAAWSLVVLAVSFSIAGFVWPLMLRRNTTLLNLTRNATSLLQGLRVIRRLRVLVIGAWLLPGLVLLAENLLFGPPRAAPSFLALLFAGALAGYSLQRMASKTLALLARVVGKGGGAAI